MELRQVVGDFRSSKFINKDLALKQSFDKRMSGEFFAPVMAVY